ncbi:competence type IV pilus minor pilin ComGG [Neobacillus notoginsengisoli]|nr:competence type IV pilus minor pilin ComGG [Neobacillus notoginsengisoli]
MNDRGFTYPLTLAFLLAISVFLAMASELLLIEEKMSKESEAILLEEYYLLSSLKKTESALQKDASLSKGSFSYERGTVRYTIASDAPGLLKVTLIVTIGNAHTVEGYGYYDTAMKKMIKWMEKN